MYNIIDDIIMLVAHLTKISYFYCIFHFTLNIHSIAGKKYIIYSYIAYHIYYSFVTRLYYTVIKIIHLCLLFPV